MILKNNKNIRICIVFFIYSQNLIILIYRIAMSALSYFYGLLSLHFHIFMGG